MSDDAFRELISQASQMGVTIVIHDDPACRFMVAPERKEVVLYRGVPVQEKVRMLKRAMRSLAPPVSHDGLPRTRDVRPVAAQEAPEKDEADKRPTIMRMKSIQHPLADALLEDLDVTMDEVPPSLLQRAAPTLGEDVDTIKTQWPDANDATVCAVCAEPRYGEAAGLTVCRRHLLGLMAGTMRPEEVMRVRDMAPGHPEVGLDRYDDKGRPRS